MYTKKPKEMGSQLMICGQVYCVNIILMVCFYLSLSVYRFTHLARIHVGGADILVRMCIHLKNYYKTRHM